MYKYALEDYFRKKEEKKKDSEPEKIVETKKSKSWMSQVCSLESLLQLIVVAVLFIMALLLYKNNSTVKDILFAKKI